MTGKPEGIFLGVMANGAGVPRSPGGTVQQAAEKIAEAQKLTAGAKARKRFRRLNGTASSEPWSF
jgi:hypothetical protein